MLSVHDYNNIWSKNISAGSAEEDLIPKKGETTLMV